jgi:DNA-directed RNA polymerase specialized sigma24 family protein
MESAHGLYADPRVSYRRFLSSHEPAMTSHDIEQLYRDHQRSLVRWLERIARCQHTVADLVQGAYLRLTQVEHPHLVQDIRTYLFRIATIRLRTCVSVQDNCSY